MLVRLIDVWNVETFDAALRAELLANAGIIRNYMTTRRRLYLEREASDHTLPYPTNPYAMEYNELLEKLGQEMQARTIRAWHYTRLTNAEVDNIRSYGIYLSTLETVRERIDAQVAASLLSAEIADALFAASPFHHREQIGARSNKLWMTSYPHPVNDSGVTLLLNNWGGEAVYFWLREPALQALVTKIGVPRVLEVAVPLDATRHAYSAGRAVAATFALTLGCKVTPEAFDLYCIRPLGAESVVAIQSEGEPNFAALAQGYPLEFRAASWSDADGA